jgi:hypothetical protein
MESNNNKNNRKLAEILKHLEKITPDEAAAIIIALVRQELPLVLNWYTRKRLSISLLMIKPRLNCPFRINAKALLLVQ